MRGETVSFDDCDAEGKSDLALRVHIPDLDETFWIPQSQIHADREVFDFDEDDDYGRSGTLVVMKWFAKEEKWI